METDLWRIPSKHPKISNISCFSSHTVSPPAWLYQGLSLMGHGGPGKSEVSSFQERPRLLAAAEDPEVPIRSYRLNWMNETNEAISLISHGSLEVQHLKSMAKCGTCHGMLVVSVFIWDHVTPFAHGRTVHFLQISQVPKWDFIGSHISFSHMSMAKFLFANSYRLPTKMQVTDLSGQPLF